MSRDPYLSTAKKLADIASHTPTPVICGGLRQVEWAPPEHRRIGPGMFGVTSWESYLCVYGGVGAGHVFYRPRTEVPRASLRGVYLVFIVSWSRGVGPKLVFDLERGVRAESLV